VSQNLVGDAQAHEVDAGVDTDAGVGAAVPEGERVPFPRPMFPLA
jgi:hypothetical protein